MTKYLQMILRANSHFHLQQDQYWWHWKANISLSKVNKNDTDLYKMGKLELLHILLKLTMCIKKIYVKIANIYVRIARCKYNILKNTFKCKNMFLFCFIHFCFKSFITWFSHSLWKKHLYPYLTQTVAD